MTTASAGGFSRHVLRVVTAHSNKKLQVWKQQPWVLGQNPEQYAIAPVEPFTAKTAQWLKGTDNV